MSGWRNIVFDDTIIMIDKLINLKVKINDLSDNHTEITIRYTISIILILIYFSIFIILHLEKGPFIAIFTSFFYNIIHIGLLLIPTYLHFKKSDLNLKLKSENKKLENLRHEVIDHLKSPWFQYGHSSLRDEISEEMDSYNINVRYKGDS